MNTNRTVATTTRKRTHGKGFEAGGMGCFWSGVRGDFSEKALFTLRLNYEKRPACGVLVSQDGVTTARAPKTWPVAGMQRRKLQQVREVAEDRSHRIS